MFRICRVLLMFSALTSTDVTGEGDVMQLPPWMVVSEVGIVSMNCSIATMLGAIHWYRQVPNQPPQYLVMSNRENDQPERITASISGDYKISILTVKDARLNDTAIYLCAMKSQCGKQMESAY
ncbi:hypothetical protein chiPu_0025496 [Chiloscyllium punctatum]|uniref:Ig-like domain-containing protein n=1 Tax=Chiloscyllium punctatum TaxID=137246 RepID=A0A401TFA6_CHIPU|nr:hypothetical protein [Chiloscyllium punctatum]